MPRRVPLGTAFQIARTRTQTPRRVPLGTAFQIARTRKPPPEEFRRNGISDSIYANAKTHEEGFFRYHNANVNFQDDSAISRHDGIDVTIWFDFSI